MTKTTAQYRLEARDHENACRWADATYCLAMALRVYPKPKGKLAELDMHKLNIRMQTALYMAKETDPNPGETLLARINAA